MLSTNEMWYNGDTPPPPPTKKSEAKEPKKCGLCGTYLYRYSFILNFLNKQNKVSWGHDWHSHFFLVGALCFFLWEGRVFYGLAPPPLLTIFFCGAPGCHIFTVEILIFFQIVED